MNSPNLDIKRSHSHTSQKSDNSSQLGSTSTFQKSTASVAQSSSVYNAKSVLENDHSVNVGAMFFNSQKAQVTLMKEMELNLDLCFPIAVVGASNVGKSALLDTECGEYEPLEQSRLRSSGNCIDIHRKTYSIYNKKCKVNYFVVPGNELYLSLTCRYISEFPVFIYVFDVNDAVSLDLLDTWIEETSESTYSHSHWTPMRFLIANKIDTPGTRSVLTADAQEYAKQFDLIYYETSAFDITSVNSTFKSILTLVIESLELSKVSAASSMKKLNSKSTINQKSSAKRTSLFPNYFSSQYFSQENLDGRKGSITKEESGDNKYPNIFLMDIPTSRYSRFQEKRDLAQDSIITRQGTKILDWI